jgi:hypothetical protein
MSSEEPEAERQVEVSPRIQEAMRQIQMEIDSEDCGVCGSLYAEEIDHLVGIEVVRAQVSDIVRTQMEKREQLSAGSERAGGLGAPPLTREYVEERVHEGPGGETHRELVRGVETEPFRLMGDNGPIAVARSFLASRPRLADVLGPAKRT